MRFSLAAITGILLASAPAFVRAQDPNQPPPQQGQGQMVMVGQDGGLTFTPPSITASPGSNVTFMFMSKNHSVYQSSFADPCNRIDNGFAAQFFPIAPDTQNFPTITISVTSPNAIWFYCPQTNPANHCQMGMVGAINAPPDKTFEQFQAQAKGQPAPPPSGDGSSSTDGSTLPGGAPPGSSSTGAPTVGSTPPPNGGAPIINSTPSGPLPPSSTQSPTTTSQGSNNAALPGMRGASTAVVLGVLGVIASLL